MFGLINRKKDFFAQPDKERIVEAIRNNERKTSGEIRVYVESRCSWVNPLDRAFEVFYGLKMDKTDDRNAVLVYVAVKDRQLAIFGDEGIHKRVGNAYWEDEVRKMIQRFNADGLAESIRQCVMDIGDALQSHFPYNNDTDKNELPDDIVFGN